MEETSTLGLGSELSPIDSVGSLSDPEEDLVSGLFDQVEVVEENLNKVILSFQVSAVETSGAEQESQLGTEANDSDQDTMSGSQDAGSNPPTADTPAPAATPPPEFVE